MQDKVRRFKAKIGKVRRDYEKVMRQRTKDSLHV
jgi:hypothetical protein